MKLYIISTAHDLPSSSCLFAWSHFASTIHEIAHAKQCTAKTAAMKLSMLIPYLESSIDFTWSLAAAIISSKMLFTLLERLWFLSVLWSSASWCLPFCFLLVYIKTLRRSLQLSCKAHPILHAAMASSSACAGCCKSLYVLLQLIQPAQAWCMTQILALHR